MVTSEQLLRKVRAVLKEFKSCVIFRNEEISVERNYLKLFSSMKRWHTNSHISRSDWKLSFERIKHTLDVKEKMRLPGDLKSFLTSKFSKTGLTSRFSVTEILQFLEPDINRLYKEMLTNRDLEVDEFGMENIGQCLLPEDITFYEREFLPFALFLTYSQRHPNDERVSLMDDLFSIGSGSRNKDLMPEVTALCGICAESEHLSDLTEHDMEQFNIQILNKLIEHKFKVATNIYDDSSSSDESIDSNEKQFEWFNPFSSDDSESSTSNVEDACSTSNMNMEDTKFKCNVCSREFSQIDFLQFHKEWFHKTSIATCVNYVEEPETLMTSFHREKEDDEGEVPKKKRKGERKKSEKNPKERVKKSLRSMFKKK